MKREQEPKRETLDELLRRVSREEVPSRPSSELPTLSDESSEPEQDSGVDLEGELLRHLKLKVKLQLGRVRMPLGEALALKRGRVVTLDREVGDPVELLVNEIPIARGELLVVDDHFCVRVTELITTGAGGEES